MKKITWISITLCIIILSGNAPRSQEFKEKIIEETKVKHIEERLGNNSSNFKIVYENGLYTFTCKTLEDYNSFKDSFDKTIYEIVKEFDDKGYTVIYKKK